MSQHHSTEERLDRAVSARLARLRELPVDTSRLERRLEAALDEATLPQRRLRLSSLPRWTSWSGLVAAVLVLAAALTFSISFESRAVAAPMHLAKLHQAMVSGQVPVTPSTDLRAVRHLLSTGMRDDAALQELPSHLVPACCLSAVGGKPALGALLVHGNSQVSVVVADAEGVRPALGDAVARGGRRYTVHHVGSTNMVMTEVKGQFLCFMGEVPTGELVELAERALAQ